MKTLTEQEQAQLAALLAKKEAAEKISEKVKEAVERIQASQRNLQRSVANQNGINANHKDAYAKLNAIEPLFVLEETERTPGETIWYSWDEFTDEVKQAAFEHLEMEPVERFEEKVFQYSISVKGDYDLRISMKGTKMQLRCPGLNYSDRWIKLHTTIVQKVKEHIERLNYKKSAEQKAADLREETIVVLKNTFPEAKVEYSPQYVSSRYPGRQGYTTLRIAVTFSDTGLEVLFSYERKDDKIRVGIADVNFNVLAAIAKGNDVHKAVAMLQELKANLK